MNGLAAWLHVLLTRTRMDSREVTLYTEVTMPSLRKINVNKNGE